MPWGPPGYYAWPYPPSPPGYYQEQNPFAHPPRRRFAQEPAEGEREDLPYDEEIKEMIEESLDWDPLVPYGANISVDVDAGEVTLRGSVPSKRAKHAAADDAFWTPGVVGIRNNLVIEKKPPAEEPADDQE